MRLITLTGRRMRVVRLLTLLCFFHFSGLNNGFSFLIVSPGHVKSANFAPVLIERVAGVMNPASWVRAVRSGEWVHFLTKPTRAIEISSQNVIENILTESTLLQAWLNYSLRAPVSGERIVCAAEGAALDTEQSGMTVTLPTDAEKVLSFTGATAVLSRESGSSWIKIERLDLNSAGKITGIGYLNSRPGRLERASDPGGSGGAGRLVRRVDSHFKILVLGAGGRKLGDPAGAAKKMMERSTV
jgi:hypothetical protein